MDEFRSTLQIYLSELHITAKDLHSSETRNDLLDNLEAHILTWVPHYHVEIAEVSVELDFTKSTLQPDLPQGIPYILVAFANQSVRCIYFPIVRAKQEW